MKNILVIFAFAVCSQLSAQSFFEVSEEFFTQNVKDGLVKYDQINSNKSLLNDLVTLIGNYDLKTASQEEKKAFYINAYNILVIHHILNNYPAEGPLKIDGFFDQLTSKVAGKSLTLNQLEKEWLFKAFPDARLHFVLVCAAMGCPPLANYAYKPGNLEKQLKERTEYVLNFDGFIRVNKNTVEVSKIFEWYNTDFLKESGSLISYINGFHTQDLSNKSISYYEYDWSLNRYLR